MLLFQSGFGCLRFTDLLLPGVRVFIGCIAGQNLVYEPQRLGISAGLPEERTGPFKICLAENLGIHLIRPDRIRRFRVRQLTGIGGAG